MGCCSAVPLLAFTQWLFCSSVCQSLCSAQRFRLVLWGAVLQSSLWPSHSGCSAALSANLCVLHGGLGWSFGVLFCSIIFGVFCSAVNSFRQTVLQAAANLCVLHGIGPLGCLSALFLWWFLLCSKAVIWAQNRSSHSHSTA